jgi:mono/diheme cytochrome c family protein
LLPAAVMGAFLYLSTTVPVAQEPGRKAYDDNCRSCHGDAGRGGEAPRLVPLKWTYEEVLKRVRNPECDMPAFTTLELSDADVRQIVAYLKSIK